MRKDLDQRGTREKTGSVYHGLVVVKPDFRQGKYWGGGGVRLKPREGEEWGVSGLIPGEGGAGQVFVKGGEFPFLGLVFFICLPIDFYFDMAGAELFLLQTLGGR